MMSNDCEQLKLRLLDSLPQESIVNVETDGYFFTITVISSAFEGMRTLKRQQLIYGGMSEIITSGELHAVKIKAYSVSEFSNLNNN